MQARPGAVILTYSGAALYHSSVWSWSRRACGYACAYVRRCVCLSVTEGGLSMLASHLAGDMSSPAPASAILCTSLHQPPSHHSSHSYALYPGTTRRWDLVESHASVGIVLYHTGMDALLVVRQFRPPVYASAARLAAALGKPAPPFSAGRGYSLRGMCRAAWSQTSRVMWSDGWPYDHEGQRSALPAVLCARQTVAQVLRSI